MNVYIINGFTNSQFSPFANRDFFFIVICLKYKKHVSPLIKKKIKFSSYIRKFRMEQLQSHICLTASSNIGKYLRISSYIRKLFLIYDFATAPLAISLYMRDIWFSFLSVYSHLHLVMRESMSMRAVSIWWGWWNRGSSLHHQRDYFFSYCIQHCFICRPSDSTVPTTDAGIIRLLFIHIPFQGTEILL